MREKSQEYTEGEIFTIIYFPPKISNRNRILNQFRKSKQKAKFVRLRRQCQKPQKNITYGMWRSFAPRLYLPEFENNAVSFFVNRQLKTKALK